MARGLYQFEGANLNFGARSGAMTKIAEARPRCLLERELGFLCPGGRPIRPGKTLSGKRIASVKADTAAWRFLP